VATKLSKFVFLKNAFANVIRGSFSALVAVVLPPFLVRILPTETFSIWVLILQLTAYVAYFDFGVQTAVGRFVAYANELGDFKQRDRVINTSLAILSASGLLAILFVCLLAWQLPHIFPKIPDQLLTDAKIAILLVGGSLTLGLPFSVFNGIFIGIQRYEIPAVITSAGKLTTALLILIAAKMSGNLILMSAAIAGVNLISYFLQFLASQNLNNNIKYSYKLISKEAGKEIFIYSFSLSIWSFSMLLVTGLDTTIVGIFDFNAVGYFSVVASLVTLIAGLQNAVFSALLPVAAVMDAQSDAKQLGRLLITSTRYGMLILLVTGIPLILAAKPFLTIWVGARYAENGASVLQLLVIANIVRLSASPYATLLIGTAQQRLVIISPLVEGFSNLIASLSMGGLLGPIGVALGTVFGGMVGIIYHLLYNMPRTKGILFDRLTYLKDGLLRPSAGFILFILIVLTINLFDGSQIAQVLLMIFSIVTAVITFWYCSLLRKERHKILLFTTQIRKSIDSFF
jgi:O-antigen/teichoic acid export membrane protein